MDRWLLLTGGGHVNFFPGLETIIKGGRQGKVKILSSLDGWEGVQRKCDGIVDITDHPLDGLYELGGSFLGSSRKKPDLNKVEENIRRYGIDVVIAFGGDDTLGVANELFQNAKIPVVGWPKTMDNDTQGSYATVGFIRAAEVASANTLEAIANAYTNKKIVLLPMFGRDADWVVAAAADYGHADFVIPVERRDISLSDVAKQIHSVYEENKAMYGRPFAVVPVSEAASGLKGLEPYFERFNLGEKVEKDGYKNPKFEPELVGLALRNALKDILSFEENRIALKVLTYHLRDGKLPGLDEEFARKTAEECLRLIDSGNFGRVATVQDPEYSEYFPQDSATHINAHGKRLYVASVPLEVASQKRYLRDAESFFDYGKLRPTERMTRYLRPLLGQKLRNPREFIVPFKTAVPANVQLV